ncbi:MAG: LacI family transcriptional regulator [Clostridiales bacterium]|nr:LacI family transcriptional regulator [Clostridiales bacterium]
MDVKIKDVAQLAGVSISTVSNTLSGRKNVSREKQAAVMEAVRKLGYVPNINAQLLKSRRTGNIGLFLPFIDGLFYTTLMQEVYHACTEKGYGMFTHVARDFDSQKTAATILSCNIDAAIVLNDHLLDSEIETLTARGIPLVFKDRRIVQKGVSSIVIDNQGGTMLQVNYLAHTGHKKIAYLCGVPNHDGNERKEAFKKAMKNVRLPVTDELIMEGQFSRRVAYNCVHAIMHRSDIPRPDAILCANDEMAFGCIDALKDMHISVPKDISVMGFDDLGAEACLPALSTVGYSMRDFAYQAVEEAVRLIHDPMSDGVLKMLETQMKIRSSVALRF